MLSYETTGTENEEEKWVLRERFSFFVQQNK